MACSDSHICVDPNTQEKKEIIETFFGLSYGEDGGWKSDFDEFFAYYNSQTLLLRLGKGKQWACQWTFPIRCHRDVTQVVRILQASQVAAEHSSVREQIRTGLGMGPKHSDIQVDQVIDLALRLWLMINFRPFAQIGLGQGQRCVQWQDGWTLETQLEKLFEKSTTELSPSQRRLHPHFKASNMVNICRLKIRWTSSLEDHLRLDRGHKILSIFAHRRFLQFSRARNSNSGSPVPIELLDETSRTLDLLFPSWDQSTKRMLQKMKLDFHQIDPRDRSLDLRHYPYWKDRLLELYEDIYLAPPEGWAQLWYDRRDPQKFWTFWVALIVLLLTVLSTIATLLQTVLALQQS